MLVFNPGPTKVHPELSTWLKEGFEEGVYSKHHRSQWFQDLFERVEQKLKKLAQLDNSFKLFLYGCASTIWEKSLESLAYKKSFFFVTGEFGKRWLHCAKSLKIPVTYVISDHSFSGSIASFLKKKKGVDTICLVHGETSLGQDIPSNEIEMILSLSGNAILILDAVSTFPVKNFDYNKADVIIFSIQKCFALPSGLGVALVSSRSIERALEVFKSRKRAMSGFESFKYQYMFSTQFMTPATPNVTGLWLLEKVLDKYLTKGLNKIRDETEKRAIFLRNKFKAIGLLPLISSPDWQSNTVLTFRFHKAVELRDKLKELGFEVSLGFGDLSDSVIRIANFPAYTFEDFKMLYEAVLKVLDVNFPIGLN